MDVERFDALLRSFSTRAPRRVPLRALAGAVLGAGLVRLGAQEAAAKCTNVGNRCNQRRGDACCGGAKCQGGRCHCPGGAVELHGACFFRGRCAPAAEVCDAKCGNAPGTRLHPGCFCGTTVEAETLCFENDAFCVRPCDTTADCAKGQACFPTGDGCDGKVGTCFRACPGRNVAR